MTQSSSKSPFKEFNPWIEYIFAVCWESASYSRLPFSHNMAISMTYLVVTQQTRASVDTHGSLSYTQARVKNESNKETNCHGQ